MWLNNPRKKRRKRKYRTFATEVNAEINNLLFILVKRAILGNVAFMREKSSSMESFSFKEFRMKIRFGN